MFYFVGGPSGSGKTSLAQKMANIVGCEVVSLESYYKSEQVKDFKYDEFSSLDLSLLSKVIFEGVYALHPDIRNSLDIWIAVVRFITFTQMSLVAYQDLLKVLDPGKVCSSVQNFIDVYLRLPGIHSNGQLMEGDCIRVRICEGRFALLIREVSTNHV
ncbi:hypothetical protein BHE74_00036830 [Ensete ventricosum]|uniref:Uncharacterized protein n=1 Tax=Ensete ventricosum TaxID=4639 RepID=A0A444GIV3_ENSVE|nr:hypothetical protein B296_00038919 [Ensete ventricosum]RWW34711.1 hypothetical protein GW17_00000508 [Ensete ventricosum]RWW56453.1 hypothetical protein BHE74_00036830 [Ensete ventricosum]RZR84007.1 hypothetical protein BHM03_00010735 [Ensete ventricosum]